MKAVWVLLCLVAAEARPRGESRVVGGSDSDIARWPYQCSLRYFNDHECGCSILTNTSVLTAAHCLQGRVFSNFDVLVGTTDRTDTTTGTLFGVTDYILHPGFDDDVAGMPNDIATVQVDAPFNFSDPNVAPLTLPSGATSFVGNVCNVTGWGRTTSNSDILPDMLQELAMPVISNGECLSRVNDLFTANIVASQICVYTDNSEVGPCEGDDGSPLSCMEGGVNKVAGIQSWTPQTLIGNCDLTYPSVYTRTTSFLQWIIDNASGSNLYYY